MAVQEARKKMNVIPFYVPEGMIVDDCFNTAGESMVFRGCLLSGECTPIEMPVCCESVPMDISICAWDFATTKYPFMVKLKSVSLDRGKCNESL